jgi:hypothetical protein
MGHVKRPAHLSHCAPWTRAATSAALALALALAPAVGCGYGHLQTARPTPRGAIDVAVGQGFVYNKTIQMRRDAEDGGDGVSLSNLPIMINSRLGITDRLDIGLRLFFVGGLLADTKVNFLNPKSPWALSGSVGFGAAADLSTRGAYLVHLPLWLRASYDFKFGLTPYVALGYSLFWIYGRDADPMIGATYLDRSGSGDHLVTAAVGLQYRLGRHVALLFEYNLWQPVVDDPGDFFSFERSHIAIFGVRIRGRIWGRPLGPPPKLRPLPPPVDPGPPPYPTPGAQPTAPPPPPPPAP